LLGLRLYVEKDNINAQKVYERTGMDGEHYRMFEWFA
jgi:ribosomal protein S18 acetylase RimI-like enzyme